MESVFLESALAASAVESRAEIVGWLSSIKETTRISINRCPFSEMAGWLVDVNKGGRLVHKSGKFFSIEGIEVETNWGMVRRWNQPIINQPEIGYLGLIARKIDGVLKFLVQAKAEPGNINSVQLSPTLQATKSNYTQVHQGQKPRYLEVFQNVHKSNVLIDQLQSEQGGRFLKKRNRNIVILVDEEIELYDGFIWLTLYQIKDLMRLDNIVNMDMRTVLSGIRFGAEAGSVHTYLEKAEIGEPERLFLNSALSKQSLNSHNDIIKWITKLKCQFELKVNSIPLNEVSQWVIGEDEIRHVEDKYFRVIGLDVEIENRETQAWSQPLIESVNEGLCAFICKKIDGVLHFIVQAKMECGNFDILELAPTVQCLTGNYRVNVEGVLPFLDYVLNTTEESIVFSAMFSEEGGRFFQEQNLNQIIVVGDEFPEQLPSNYIWMTLNQLLDFLRFNNYLNVQCRSLVSAIQFLK